MLDFQRPDRICGSFPSAFKLAGLVEIAHSCIGKEPFFPHTNRSVIRSRGFGINGFFFDGRNGFFACEASDFSAQSRDQYGKPNDPFGISLAFRRLHFNTILVPEQALSKGAVISFHHRLVPVNLRAPTANVCFVFFHFFRDGAHEFYAKVDPTQLWPFQSPAFVINVVFKITF